MILSNTLSRRLLSAEADLSDSKEILAEAPNAAVEGGWTDAEQIGRKNGASNLDEGCVDGWKRHAITGGELSLGQ